MASAKLIQPETANLDLGKAAIAEVGMFMYNLDAGVCTKARRRYKPQLMQV